MQFCMIIFPRKISTFQAHVYEINISYSWSIYGSEMIRKPMFTRDIHLFSQIKTICEIYHHRNISMLAALYSG